MIVYGVDTIKLRNLETEMGLNKFLTKINKNNPNINIF